MTTQRTIDWEAARDTRDRILVAVETAQSSFVAAAQEFVLEYLANSGPASGEHLTDMCKAAQIIPEAGDKAFGSVYGGLSRKKLIVKCGTCPRRKGNLTDGATIWKLKD